VNAGLPATYRREHIADGVDDIGQALKALERGEPKAADELIPLVYDELRHLAAYRLAQEKPGQTLQATALVHEAYLRLIKSGDHPWRNSRHFFAAAAEAMRRILVDNARQKQSQKRGGGSVRVDFQSVDIPCPVPSEEILRMDEALETLQANDPETVKLVKLRFFVGMTQQEAADCLGVSLSTAERMWTLARAWIERVFKDQAAGD
jgi:RNA polymerase sigma factor (TIGR02999 family)